MPALGCLRLIGMLWIAAPALLSATITGIQLTNNSTPSFLDEESIRAREFRTEAFAPSSGTQVGDSVSFTSRMAWTSSHRVFPGPSGLPLTHGASVAYDLTFTVDDPAMLGYTVSIDSTIRGYVTALWEDNAGVFPSLVFSSGTLMSARLDDGSGFGPLLVDIGTDTEVAMATPADPFVNVLVSRSGTHQTGVYTGTRTFTLRYGTIAANTGVGLQNYNIGEGNVRFGLDSAYANFRNASYPGADGEAADQHGHFVTVAANFLPDMSEVPEPAPLQLFAAAALATAALKRRIRKG